MVKVLSDCFITGACHAPVDSRQGEGWWGSGRFWVDREFIANLTVVKGERYNETGKIRI